MGMEKYLYYGGVRECIGSRTNVLEQCQKSNRYAECRPFSVAPDQAERSVDDNWFGESASVRPVVVDSNVCYSARYGSALHRRDS